MLLPNKSLPSFLVVGAAKSGTTTIYNHLRGHPDLSLPESQQEGRFFSKMRCRFAGPGDFEVERTIPRTLDAYLELFPGNGLIRGDVSPDYLFYHETTIKTLRELGLENVKIIIVLRNPTERAYSQYMHFVRDNRETLTFDEALASEDCRAKKGWEWAWQYKAVGMYAAQVEHFIKVVPNTRVYLFEELVSNSQRFMDDIYHFLDLNNILIRRDAVYNRSGVLAPNARGWLYRRLLLDKNLSRALVKSFTPKYFRRDIRRKLKAALFERNLVKPPMNNETRRYLSEFFRRDIARLERIINRDLSNWLR